MLPLSCPVIKLSLDNPTHEERSHFLARFKNKSSHTHSNHSKELTRFINTEERSLAECVDLSQEMETKHVLLNDEECINELLNGIAEINPHQARHS
jgi:hypothetical protein